MFKIIVKLILPALFLTVAANKAYAYDNGDFQIWHTEGQEAGIGKAAKLTQEEEWRFGEDSSEFYYQHYDWGVVYAFDKRLELGFNYRQVYEKIKRKWMEENRPHVNAAVKLDLWKFKFEDRSRIEYRHFRYRDDFIRYRNRFTLKYPFNFKKLSLALYASDEIFIASNAAGFNENRFYSGLEFSLAKYAKADIYYLLKENRVKADKWSWTNTLGTKLKILF
ncbi:MAG: DUF2490 domain-containing protein [Candidatus Omnitrophota bacterium]